MASSSKSNRSRHFALENEEINALLFADHSDSDEDCLDEEDLCFLEADVDANDNTNLGDPTLIVIDDARAQDHDTSQENANETEAAKVRGNSASKPGEQTIAWKKKINPPIVPSSDVTVEWGKLKLYNLTDKSSPLEVFLLASEFEKLLKNILVPQTNLYAQQKGVVFATTPEELKAYLGMNFVMGYHVLPSLRDYWCTDSDMRVGYVAEVMTYERFVDIRANLHFSDNSKQLPRENPNHDRASKIRPIIDHFNSAFLAAVEPEEHQSIDEHMIKFKGHNIMKQYVKNKPVRWGFKMWARCASKSGYLYEFDFYTGKKQETEFGLGESVVLQLSDKLKGTVSKLYFDNFFTSVKLMQVLLDDKILACGTVRSNRKYLPTNLKKDKDMKRGDSDFREANGIYALKWMDNKSVLLLSTITDPRETAFTERREKAKKEKTKVTCPTLVGDYNTYMGGVDLMDQKKVSYEVDRRSRIKYYLRPFHDILDIAINNAYILYQKLNPGTKIKSLDFRRSVARGLVGTFTSRKHGLHSYTSKKRCTDSPAGGLPVSHLPEMTESRKRCKFCSTNGRENRTNVICKTCGIHLCFTAGRNCYAEYHK